jgi:hypothetical protein
VGRLPLSFRFFRWLSLRGAQVASKYPAESEESGYSSVGRSTLGGSFGREERDGRVSTVDKLPNVELWNAIVPLYVLPPNRSLDVLSPLSKRDEDCHELWRTEGLVGASEPALCGGSDSCQIRDVTSSIADGRASSIV